MMQKENVLGERDFGTNCKDCERFQKLGDVCVLDQGKKFLWEYCRDFVPSVALPDYRELMKSVKEEQAEERRKLKEKKEREKRKRLKERLELKALKKKERQARLRRLRRKRKLKEMKSKMRSKIQKSEDGSKQSKRQSGSKIKPKTRASDSSLQKKAEILGNDSPN